MTPRLAIPAALALLLTGCEIYAVPAPENCPGKRKGTFTFSGSVQSPTPPSCAWASGQYNATVEYPGSINFAAEPGQEAWLCIDQPHAQPRVGLYAPVSGATDEYTVTMAYTSPGTVVGNCTCPSEAVRDRSGCTCPPTSPLSSCSCPVDVTERVTGQMVPITQGTTGYVFTGTQVVSVRHLVSPGETACDCQSNCDLTYVLAGSPL